MASFAITVTVGVISYGFTNSAREVFLAPLLILGLVLVQIVRSIYKILRISTYIKKFLERADTQLQWEGLVGRFREKERSRCHPGSRRSTWRSYELVLLGTGWLCVGLSLSIPSWVRPWEVSSEWSTVVAAIVWMLVSIVVHRQVSYAVSGELEKTFLKIWEDI